MPHAFSKKITLGNNWYDNVATFTELDDTIVVARPAFVASFYSHPGLATHAVAILDAWLALLPPKTVLWYSHEETRRYMKLTPKALAKIRANYAPDALSENFASYFIKSAPENGPVDECHAYSFELFAASAYSGYVFVTFPLDYVQTQGSTVVLRWFCDWCARFEFTHAGAGYGYEQAWFDEQQLYAGPVQLATGLRFHGVRVWERESARFRERNKNTLDTVAWLTYLDNTSIGDIGAGAIDRIDSRVNRYQVGSGLVFQAGPEPDPCDANRRGDAYALLKSVNDAIVPIRTRKWYQNGWAGFDSEKEDSWLSRMD